MTVPIIASARARSASGSSCRIGFSVSAMITYGQPCVEAMRRANFAKVSVTTITVGMPRSSRAGVTWLHHVVQEPQSPVAVMTTSTRRASASSWPRIVSRSLPVRIGSSRTGCSITTPFSR